MLSVIALGGGSPLFAQQPSAAALRNQADRCRELLMRSVVDFYLPQSLDQVHGGYLEELDSAGSFFSGESKFLVLQARQLWLFSTLAEAGIRPQQTRAAADSGFQFLQAHFLDPTDGGYISRVKRDGTAEDTRKHVYLNSFALYGLVAYYRATNNPKVLDAAWELFDVLQAKAYDREHGGYQEFFYADWTPITDPGEPRYVGAIDTKTYNTHLHLLEAFTQLHRVSPKPRLANRLSELMLINTRTVQHPGHSCNIDGWSRDWTMIDEPSNLRASYGHDVECVWLVFDAARTMNIPISTLRTWAVSVVQYSLSHGYDHQHGGFFYFGPLGQPATDRHKEWWVQSEALVSMLEMYQLTGEERYYEAFSGTLRFVTEHQVAPGTGGWWAVRDADGSHLPNHSRTSAWQGGYHNGRALLLCSQLLDALADDRELAAGE